MKAVASINSALSVIVEATGNSEWILGGSAGLLLRGLDLPAEPRDLDLYCDTEQVNKIHNGLKEYALDTPVVSETSLYCSTLSHYDILGLKVELVGGFQVSANGCVYKSEVKEVLIPYGDIVKLITNSNGLAVRIVPLAHELWFNMLRGRDDRIRMIVDEFKRNPACHLDALGKIEARNRFSRQAVNQLHQWIDIVEAGDQEWMVKLSSGLPDGQRV